MRILGIYKLVAEYKPSIAIKLESFGRILHVTDRQTERIGVYTIRRSNYDISDITRGEVLEHK